MTKSHRMRESAVMISSTIPSAKYSCSGSPLMFWNGSTAIEGFSGNVRPRRDLSRPGRRDSRLGLISDGTADLKRVNPDWLDDVLKVGTRPDRSRQDRG